MWTVFYGLLSGFVVLISDKTKRIDLQQTALVLFGTWIVSNLVHSAIDPANIITVLTLLDITAFTIVSRIWYKRKSKELIFVLIIFITMIATHLAGALNFMFGEFVLRNYSLLLNILFILQLTTIGGTCIKERIRLSARNNNKLCVLSSGVSYRKQRINKNIRT